MMMLSPRDHFSSTQGAVPTGRSRISPPPPVALRCSSDWMPKGVKAALARNAGSGLHMLNVTVKRSVASIDLILPP